MISSLLNHPFYIGLVLGLFLGSAPYVLCWIGSFFYRRELRRRLMQHTTWN